MIKLLGAILVLVSAYAIGSLLAMQVKERERWLKDIKTALFLFMGELEYHQLPMPDALELTGGRHNGKLSAFFGRVSEELKKKEGRSFQEIWSEAAQQELRNSPLSKEQQEEFAGLGTYVMEPDAETRRNSIDFYLKRLEEDIMKLRETGADKAYLCRMLGMLGGIFLLILVL